MRYPGIWWYVNVEAVCRLAMENEPYVYQVSHEYPTPRYGTIAYVAGEDGANADRGCCKAIAHVPFKFTIMCIDRFVQEATHHG